MPPAVKRSFDAAIRLRGCYNQRYNNDDQADPQDKFGHAESLGHCIQVRLVASAVRAGPSDAGDVGETLQNLYDSLGHINIEEEETLLGEEISAFESQELSATYRPIVYDVKIIKERIYQQARTLGPPLDLAIARSTTVPFYSALVVLQDIAEVRKETLDPIFTLRRVERGLSELQDKKSRENAEFLTSFRTPLQSVNEGNPASFEAAFAADLLALDLQMCKRDPKSAIQKPIKCGTAMDTRIDAINKHIVLSREYEDRAELLRGAGTHHGKPITACLRHAYLYTILKRKGHLDVVNEKGQKIFWGLIKAVSEGHSKDLFLASEPPVELDRVFDRLKLAAGINLGSIM
ncbi:hypothetical protein K458DRAFT_391229 [Lentithecium fluviatile CBS 122367]|uniref:Uncharacterized protein n=1 Tax=Lentithecium fluviatile CBS 122367 TaxID=1168545 RepID=A0A6G1IWD7_9PLEO|nr:hypothetical protein K458DRAFT_391229 [Lentithecium fluviatile CBS 122367]